VRRGQFLSALFAALAAHTAVRAETHEPSPMTKLDKVRAVLRLPRDLTTWSAREYEVGRNHDAFLAIDQGQEPEATAAHWAHLFGDAFPIEIAIEDADNAEGFIEIIRYAGRTVQTPLTYSRADGIITVLTLNALLGGEVVIRFCIYESGSSVLGFLPLSRADWATLEAEFGARSVAAVFSPLPATWAAFEEELIRFDSADRATLLSY
jgi:hypothetical protein